MSTVIKENCDQLFLRPDIYSTTAKVPSAGLIYGSGITPLDGQGKLVPGGIKEHTAHIIKNIEKALKNAGSDLHHLVKVNIYLKEMDDFVEMNKVYDELIPAPKPARTCIQAGKLPGDVLVELEYVAAMPAGQASV